MIEVIALIFLCKKIGLLAVQKGLKPGLWKFYTVMAWLLAEMFGVMLSVAIFASEQSVRDNIVAAMALALVSAFGGYLFIKSVLDKKPDYYHDDIGNIGIDDLKPPKKS